jgi:hypothetical protein
VKTFLTECRIVAILKSCPIVKIMKNTLLALTLMSSMFGLSAFAQVADFSGHWVGTGTIYEKPLLVGDTQQSTCSKIELWMEQGAGTLTTKRYLATCGWISPDSGPNHMKIANDGKVTDMDEDEEIGTLKNDTLITIDDSSGTVTYAFNLKVSGSAGERSLQSYYGVRNGMGSVVIEALDMKLVP